MTAAARAEHRLDAAIGDHVAAMRDLRATAARWRSTLGPRLVVVVDDEPGARRVVGAVLRRLGNVEVVELGDPEEAVRLARERPVRLWVLDLHMPKLSGMEVAQAIRSLAAIPLAPIVVVTGIDPELAAELAVDMGANVEALPKPVDAPALLAACRRLLRDPG